MKSSLAILCALLLSACSTSTELAPPLSTLRIENVSSRQVESDQAITISGACFDSTVAVYLSGRQITIDQATSSEIKFTAPFIAADYTVSVSTHADSVQAGSMEVSAVPHAVVTMPEGPYEIIAVSIETPASISKLYKHRYEETYFPSIGELLKARIAPIYSDAVLSGSTIAASNSDFVASIAFTATQDIATGTLHDVSMSVTNKPPIMPGMDDESLSFACARMVISQDGNGNYIAEATGNFSFDRFNYRHVWDHPVGPGGGSGSSYASSLASHPTSIVRIVLKPR